MPVAHIRQYALPAGGLRSRTINDLRSAHNAAGSSTTHLAASGNRQYGRPGLPLSAERLESPGDFVGARAGGVKKVEGG